MVRYLLIPVLCIVAGAASAQKMYRYVDPAGHTVFSDRPPPTGVPYTTHDMPRPAPHGSPPPAPHPSSAPPQATSVAPAPQAPASQAPAPQSTVTVDAEAERDRRAFVPEDEAARERESMRIGVPDDEQRKEREGMRLNR